MKLAKNTISSFLEQFGNANDVHTKLFLETLFEELFNGNALPLSDRQGQEGVETDNDPLWTDAEI